jgi:hypothetical protein
MQALADSMEHGSYADLLHTLDHLDVKQRKAAATWLTAQLKLPPAPPCPKCGPSPRA